MNTSVKTLEETGAGLPTHASTSLAEGQLYDFAQALLVEALRLKPGTLTPVEPQSLPVYVGLGEE